MKNISFLKFNKELTFKIVPAILNVSFKTIIWFSLLPIGFGFFLTDGDFSLKVALSIAVVLGFTISYSFYIILVLWIKIRYNHTVYEKLKKSSYTEIIEYIDTNISPL